MSDELKPLRNTRPTPPAADPDITSAVRQWADFWRCSELEAAQMLLSVMRNRMEQEGLLHPLPMGRRQ